MGDAERNCTCYSALITVDIVCLVILQGTGVREGRRDLCAIPVCGIRGDREDCLIGCGLLYAICNNYLGIRQRSLASSRSFDIVMFETFVFWPNFNHLTARRAPRNDDPRPLENGLEPAFQIAAVSSARRPLATWRHSEPASQPRSIFHGWRSSRCR